MSDAPSSSATGHEVIEDIGVALGIVALAALSSPVSQLTLSPVFGAIPASINHDAAIIVTFIFGFMLHSIIGKGRNSDVRSGLPVLAAVVPGALCFALLVSEQLGIVGGAILAGLVSCHSLIIPSAYATAAILDRHGVGNVSESIPPAFVNASMAVIPFMLLERFFRSQVLQIITLSQLLTPADVQLLIAAAFVLLCTPGPLAVVTTWTTIIATYLFNPHGNGLYAQSLLRSSLATHDFTLLARQWSTTGYISVLESQSKAYRVLRCDHSLLGGEFLLNETRRTQGWTTNEPIYSIFTMLEAVRLVETDPAISDADAKALVIGLGIGTAPKALIQHGIDTTIVELDPAVYEYATKYFDLPRNHTAVIGDAVSWAQQQASEEEYKRRYFDYIIHDVFTGGAEPLSLFTNTFLSDLRALLKPNGVAAINYAGDLTQPLTIRALNTIDLAFDRQCQVYSDDTAREDGTAELFTNFVVFCRNLPGEITFRQPVKADYLGSFNRRRYMLPPAAQLVEKTWTESKVVLRPEDIKSLRKTQEASAQKHWSVMRMVLPARVWELY